MSVNAKQYRDHLYRLRSHPATAVPEGFVDQRNSFLTVYLSLVPFIACEYLAEVNYEFLPSGIVFPLGYLLFWAFYYTYYKPGFLEERLSTPGKWDLNGVPTILVGVTIWFVKVTVVELGGILFGRWLLGQKKKTPKAHAHRQPHAQPHHRTAGSKTHAGAGPRASGPHSTEHSEGTRFHHNPGAQEGTRFHRASPSHEPALPRDIMTALGVLGFTDAKHSWSEIHRRYRELAKKYHPDLNHEITAVGRRFMMVDAAYRRLGAVKGKYFPEKRNHA